MTGSEFQLKWISALSKRYDEREAKELLRHWLEDRHQISRSAWIRSLDNAFTLDYQEDLDRLITGEPMQYIVGTAFFDDLQLKVNPSVLIPRPETEDLVRKIAETAPEKTRVLDIGTGSGAIALALKKRRSDLEMTGIDISEGALRVAKANAQHHHLDVKWDKRDILQWPIDRTYDLVISNPPYIEEREMSSMSGHVVQHEPHLALFVPNGDPLLFYRVIANRCKEGGVSSLWFECHIDYVNEVADLLQKNGYSNVQKWPDITSRDRFVSGNV